MKPLLNGLQKITENLMSESLEVDCKKITLTQQTSVKTRVRYSAPGRIIQDKRGIFTIHLIWQAAKKSKFPPSASHTLCSETLMGELYPKDAYFKLTILTATGEVWTGRDVWLEEESYSNTRTVLFTGECELLETKTKTRYTPPKNYCTYICNIENFNFPNNEFTNFGDDGKTRNISSFDIKNKHYKITTREKHIEVNITSKGTISRKNIEASLHALEMITGSRLNVILMHERHKNISKTTVSPPNFNDQSWNLPSPVPHTSPRELKNCVILMDAIMKKHNTGIPKFYYYWRELGLAQSTSLEAFALCISVNVEGMVDYYFPSLRSPDPIFIEECQVAKAFIDSLITPSQAGPVTARVKDKILNSLSNASSPSVKNALYKLFDKKTVDEWNRIRHPAAHGSLAEKKFETQTLFDSSNSCLHMFYEMIMKHIEFNGRRVNFSVKGHPLYEPLD